MITATSARSAIAIARASFRARTSARACSRTAVVAQVKQQHKLLPVLPAGARPSSVTRRAAAMATQAAAVEAPAALADNPLLQVGFGAQACG